MNKPVINAGDISVRSLREAGLMVTVASQGVGKSHANKILISKYVRDNISTGVKGRKVLIFDVNGEYGTEEFGKDGIPPVLVRSIGVKDVKRWCASPVIEVRRLDLRGLHMDKKFEILNYVIEVVNKCLFVIEDINKVVLEVTHLKRIVGTIVGLRHKACDVIVSYQALRDVPPRFLSNCKWVRMHYFTGDVMDIHGKITEPEVFKIAQIIVNTRYYHAVSEFKSNEIDESDFKKKRSFCVYVGTDPHKIEGAFNKEQFTDACVKFLRMNKKRLNDEMSLTGCSQREAETNQAEQLFNQYYGNKQ